MKCLFLFLILVNYSFAQIAFNESSQDLGVSVNCGNTYLGSGITFFDYDNDGLDDLSIATSSGDAVRFFKNINGNFVEQNLNILEDNQTNKQVNWVDIDNDGDNDLFVTNYNSSIKLFENLGNLDMQDITSTSGMLLDDLPYFGASWGDYNNDGFLDVFICVRDTYIPNILYKNNGDNSFTLVNSEAGLLTTGKMSFCSVFIDYDKDGDQDIYVSNDKYTIPNLMYRNNGDGTFTEVGAQTNTAVSIDAMSATVDDINNDGWLDIYVTNDPYGNVLLINNADGTFTDMASAYNITFNSSSWGAVFLDADNDEDLDLYISSESNGTSNSYLSSGFYEFMDSSSYFQLNNNAVPNDFAYSYSNAIGDSDNDGYPEIVVNHINHNNVFLWKNNTPQSNNWLKVKLEGTISNRNGVGSLIEISINNEKQYRYTLCGEGYLSQNSGTEIFGVGTHSTIDYVKVTWLSGIEDILYNVNANTLLNIVEGSTLSMADNSLSNFKVYPNPVNGYFQIDSKDVVAKVEVNDALGSHILAETPNQPNVKIDMSSLVSGIYFVTVSSQNTKQTFKIVKQ